MITALIIAGGVGKRMGQDIPKQFITIEGKPIIIYTLESFEQHPMVDRVLVVCKHGWEETLWGYIKEYGLKKFSGLFLEDRRAKSPSTRAFNSLKTILTRMIQLLFTMAFVR